MTTIHVTKLIITKYLRVTKTEKWLLLNTWEHIYGQTMRISFIK